MTVQNHNFSTRANIINCIGDHEFKGHYKSGFQHEKGKKDINDVIKANGYE